MPKVVKHVVCQPLESPELISLLSIFCNLFQSSIGPLGKLKILVTEGGYLTLTSSSTRIINNIVIDNPICIFISQVMKSHLTDFKDCGHYLGVLTSSLLYHLLLSLDKFPCNLASSFIQSVTSDLIALIDSSKIHINFDTVKQLLPVVKSVLTSKPACCLSRMEIESLTVIITKAFLNSINDNDVGVGNISVVCGECCGLDNPTLIPGCLYQTTEDIHSLYKSSYKKQILIVFDTMLSNEKPPKLNEHDRISVDFEQCESFKVNKAIIVLEWAVGLGVSIVACQKVVHPWLKLYLRRNGIALLDRMGTEVTRQVVSVSGAVPLSDYTRCSSEESLKPFLGYVNCVQEVSWGGKTFISLEREKKFVSTLLVRASNPEAAEELKMTIEQALSSLRRLLSQPFLTPGAGCSEMMLAAGLQSLVVQKERQDKYPQSLSQLQACVRLVQISLLSAAGLRSPFLNLAVDTAYCHAWNFDQDKDRSTCRCGLVTTEMIQAENKGWEELDITSQSLFTDCENLMYVTSSKLTENVIVDVYGSKCNALKLSLESCIGMLGIGMVVYKN